MPFRDRDWEDFQRDCDFFPAYADYVFGVDTRPEVDDEPGLHPQIFDPQPLPRPPPFRLHGLPPPMQYPAAYNSVCDGSQARTQGVSELQRVSMLRQESSLEPAQPTPCPAPRELPTAEHHLRTTPAVRASMPGQESSMDAPQPSPFPRSRNPPTAGPVGRLLYPHELVTDPTYDFIPLQQRIEVDKLVVQAWATTNSDADPPQKAQAVEFLKNISHSVALKVDAWEARLQAEARAEEEAEVHNDQVEKKAKRDADQSQRHRPPTHAAVETRRDSHRADAEAEQAAPAPGHPYAIHSLSELPAYVHSQLPHLWTCIDTISLQPPPTDAPTATRYQQAQHYMARFNLSVPPPCLPWIGLVVDGMIALHKAGSNPMAVLSSMPRVEDVLYTA